MFAAEDTRKRRVAPMVMSTFSPAGAMRIKSPLVASRCMEWAPVLSMLRMPPSTVNTPFVRKLPENAAIEESLSNAMCVPSVRVVEERAGKFAKGIVPETFEKSVASFPDNAPFVAVFISSLRVS